MKTIVGVNFRHQGKVYYFDPQGKDISRGTGVIVETQQGMEFANVVLSTREVEDEKVTGELKPIIRIATADDYDQLKLNEKNEKDALKICKEKIYDHELEMKLIRAEYAFDRSKLTFFFTADGRVDFRELVKDLASVFRTRIELRQVGVRDETRLLGGIGVCGRPLCCATWLPDFVPVSIKMAKEQNLSLNSAKISGVCGRLMCCLKNEAETYEYLNAQIPHVGTTVKTIDGVSGVVKSVDVLRQKVSVMIGNEADDDKEIRDYKVAEITFTRHKKQEIVEDEPVEEELKELLDDGVLSDEKDEQLVQNKKKKKDFKNNHQKQNHHNSNRNNNDHAKKENPVEKENQPNGGHKPNGHKFHKGNKKNRPQNGNGSNNASNTNKEN